MSMTNIEIFSPIEDIIHEAASGRMFVILDDENRENEGDLVFPAQFVTPQHINFMATYGRGLICLAITNQDAERLQLQQMVKNNTSYHHTPFTVSVGARNGITTGISAFDRAHTIRTIIGKHTTEKDIVSPGHIFPLVARAGGVVERQGHTEASIEVMRLAKLYSSAVLCEIMRDDGRMARVDDLITYARTHALKMTTIQHLLNFLKK